MATKPRIDEERGIYRREAIEYQKKRSWGEPIDVRPLSLLWCLPPLAALALLYGFFLNMTYQPRLKAQLTTSREGGTALLSIEDRAHLLSGLRSGDEVRFELGESSRVYLMRVMGIRAGPCGSSTRCIQLEGRLPAPGELPPGGPAAAALLLHPRAVFELGPTRKPDQGERAQQESPPTR